MVKCTSEDFKKSLRFKGQRIREPDLQNFGNHLQYNVPQFPAIYAIKKNNKDDNIHKSEALKQ